VQVQDVESAADLPSTGAVQQPACFDIYSGVDERAGALLRQLFERVGGLAHLLVLLVDVVDLVDDDQLGPARGDHARDGVHQLSRVVVRAHGEPRKWANSPSISFGVHDGGTDT
jgi:hypothetical protein